MVNKNSYFSFSNRTNIKNLDEIIDIEDSNIKIYKKQKIYPIYHLIIMIILLIIFFLNNPDKIVLDLNFLFILFLSSKTINPSGIQYNS